MSIDGFDGRAFDAYITRDRREDALCQECGCEAREEGGFYCAECRVYVRARKAREWLSRARARMNPDAIEQLRAREEYREAVSFLDHWGRAAVLHKDRCREKQCIECKQLRAAS